MIDKKKVAMLILACRDYEAMEVALACHLEFGDINVPIYLLQNCFGDYDAYRTLQVARRYENLYPGRINIIDWMAEGSPYENISKLLRSDIFSPYEYIIKVDDDAFPTRTGWVNEIIDCWNNTVKIHGDNLAYVTPLINNNNWGFKQIVDKLGLSEEFHNTVARDHRVGTGSSKYPFIIRSKNEIDSGAHGTIWASPHVARWLHEKTTLKPEFYNSATRNLEIAYIDCNERYSIGAILFRKRLWQDISEEDPRSTDDEHLMYMHCKRLQKKIACQQSIPFVHFAYFTQRSENRDIVSRASIVYQDFTGVNYPISTISDRLIEIEARLRWLEGRKEKKLFQRIGIFIKKLLSRIGLRRRSIK